MIPVVISGTEILHWLSLFYWPLIRIAAIFSVAPLFGGKYVPAPIRVAAAVIITITVVPMINEPIAVDPLSADGVLIAAKQILIGLGIGLILRFIFSAVAMAGQTISYSMGLGFAMMTDPQSGLQVPVIGQFLSILASLIFLSLNGHLAMIEFIARSFEVAPIGGLGPSPDAFQVIIRWSSIIFSAGISIAMPAMIALLNINLLLGIMTRVAPQLNIFSVGFPVTLMMGIIIILVTLPTLLPAFQRLMTEAFQVAAQFLGAT